jgi:hypothetical protein
VVAEDKEVRANLSEVRRKIKIVQETHQGPAMPSSDPPVATTPAKTASALLVAHRSAEAHGLPWSSVGQIAA